MIRALEFEGATARLRACTTATGLDPRAEKLLSELGSSWFARDSLLRAKKALDEGQLKEASGYLGSVPSRGVWKEPKAALAQRIRQAAVDRGAVGPGGKVLTVKPSSGSAPPQQPPSTLTNKTSNIVEDRYLREADERLAAGDAESAVSLLRACTNVVPTSAECELKLAAAQARVGKPGAAYRAYKRFLELAKPGDARVPKVRQLVRDYEEP